VKIVLYFLRESINLRSVIMTESIIVFAANVLI